MNQATASETALPAGVPPPPRRRRRWLSILLSLVIFISGFVVGAGTATISLRNTFLRAIRHPEESPAMIAARLRRPLGLDDSQVREVEAIIRKHQARFEAIRIEIQPRVVDELDEVETEVAAVLNPKQREEWHRRFASLRATWIPPLPEKRSAGKK